MTVNDYNVVGGLIVMFSVFSASLKLGVVYLLFISLILGLNGNY